MKRNHKGMMKKYIALYEKAINYNKNNNKENPSRLSPVHRFQNELQNLAELSTSTLFQKCGVDHVDNHVEKDFVTDEL